MYPWSFTKTLASDWKKMAQKAQIGVNALESVNGTKYVVHSGAKLCNFDNLELVLSLTYLNCTVFVFKMSTLVETTTGEFE